MGRKTKSSLTDKQMRFIAEYLIDKNATQAAIRTGYAANSARITGAKLLANTNIHQEIQRQISEDLKEFQVDRTTVLQELLRIATSDIRKIFDDNSNLICIKDLPDDIAAAVSSIEVSREVDDNGSKDPVVTVTNKVKLWDKNKALENLARHLKLLTDKIEVQVDDSLFDRMKRARERSRKGEE